MPLHIMYLPAIAKLRGMCCHLLFTYYLYAPALAHCDQKWISLSCSWRKNQHARAKMGKGNLPFEAVRNPWLRPFQEALPSYQILEIKLLMPHPYASTPAHITRKNVQFKWCNNKPSTASLSLSVCFVWWSIPWFWHIGPVPWPQLGIPDVHPMVIKIQPIQWGAGWHPWWDRPGIVRVALWICIKIGNIPPRGWSWCLQWSLVGWVRIETSTSDPRTVAQPERKVVALPSLNGRSKTSTICTRSHDPKNQLTGS